MSVVTSNDSQRYVRLAKETAWGQPPVYTITVGGSGGTFTLTINGQTTATIAYNAIASAVKSALEALSFVGSGNATMSGTLSGGMTVTLAGTRAAATLTGDFTSITGGGTNQVTGGPIYTAMKLKSVGNATAISMELAKEIRNAPDMQYEDSVANGGAIENWDFAGKLRPDQTPTWFAGVGFADVVTTHAGETVVYDHTQKPSNPGTTYCVQIYDGQTAWLAVGLVGTDMEITGSDGENGALDFTWKGWSCKVLKVTPPTVTMPGNTSYKMLKPTNSGVSVTINAVATSLVREMKWTWKRDAKPIFTQIGSVNPYRPEFGERLCEGEAVLLFDDTAELDAALTVPQVSRALVWTLSGVESIGTVPSTPSITITVPRYVYVGDPKVDKTTASPKLSLKYSALFDTSTAAATKVVTVDEASGTF